VTAPLRRAELAMPRGKPAFGSLLIFLSFMGKMKELYTTGQDLQRQMASAQMFLPTCEELCEMQKQ
jgi:hypothetical protein